jgi:CheY-like chemotaxis protein
MQQPNNKILLIEDDVDIRQALAEVLEFEGYRVAQASHGLEALKLLRADASDLPALILLDLMMPVMNGWEFRAEQLKDPQISDIPVIVLTAYPSDHRRGSSLDSVAALSKPIDTSLLLHTIEESMRRHSQP